MRGKRSKTRAITPYVTALSVTCPAFFRPPCPCPQLAASRRRRSRWSTPRSPLHLGLLHVPRRARSRDERPGRTPARRYTPAERRRQGGQRDRPVSGHRSPPCRWKAGACWHGGAVPRRAGNAGDPVRPGTRRRGRQRSGRPLTTNLTSTDTAERTLDASRPAPPHRSRRGRQLTRPGSGRRGLGSRRNGLGRSIRSSSISICRAKRTARRGPTTPPRGAKALERRDHEGPMCAALGVRPGHQLGRCRHARPAAVATYWDAGSPALAVVRASLRRLRGLGRGPGPVRSVRRSGGGRRRGPPGEPHPKRRRP